MATALTLIVMRPCTVQGRSFAKGEPFDPTGLPAQKVAQLIDQRWLKVDGASRPAVVAGKPMTVAGVTYGRGEPVPTDSLSPAKFAQLLEQRYLQIVPEANAAPVETRKKTTRKKTTTAAAAA